MTEAFNWSVTYLNGFYTVLQPANNNLNFDIPLAKAQIQTHPTLTDLFYFGAPSLLLDYTKITSIVPVSRDATIAYIVGLAASGAIVVSGTVAVSSIPAITGTVAVSSFPSNALSGQGSVNATISSNSVAIVLVCAASPGQFVRIRSLDAVNNLGLGTWSTITITKNATNSGGTLTAVYPGSIVFKNNLSGFSTSGGTVIWTGSVRNEKTWNLAILDPTLVNGDNLVISGQLFATSSVGISIVWNEQH